MTQEFINMLQAIAGLIAGGFIGISFGLIQDAARHRNEKRQADGKLNSGWAVMPGSGQRVAYLMIALILVQIVCPLLFTNGTQWWVSIGVAGGYGFVLFRQLARRRARRI
jgi:hypothetical protein